jgi:carotenoid cleavage dioxygenase
LGTRGICSHFQVDEHSGEMMFFNYGETAPYFHYGVVNGKNELVHYEPIELPHAAWPHDMGMSEHYCVIHDLSMFFEPEALKKGQHRLKFHRDVPARFGVIPRMGTSRDIKWFEGQPCYILHLANTYEEGDELVMDGAIQTNPVPDLSGLPKEGYARMNALLSMDLQETRMHRWRFNLKTGQTHEEDLDDEVTEFPMISGRYKGRSNRYVYNALMKPNWQVVGLKKYDWHTGQTQRWQAPAGCFVSETPFAPRDGSVAEDDGYLVTFITNLNTGKGECAVFDAREVSRGPLCRIVLPHHMPMGAHAVWTPASALQGAAV